MKRERFVADIERARKAIADAQARLVQAEGRLAAFDALRKDGQYLTVCVVDWNQGYRITYDYMRAYTDDKQLVAGLCKKGIKVHQARGADEFIGPLFKLGVYSEITERKREADDLAYDVKIHAPEGHY